MEESSRRRIRYTIIVNNRYKDEPTAKERLPFTGSGKPDRATARALAQEIMKKQLNGDSA